MTTSKMKSYKNLYPLLCSYDNLLKAYNKARKGKNSMPYVVEFRKDLKNSLLNDPNYEKLYLSYAGVVLKRIK